MTIVEFILNRVAEDEAVARSAVGPYRSESWHLGRDGENVMCFRPSSPEKVAWNLEHHGPERAAEHASWGGFQTDSDTAPHIARHDPARVLAECAAKRAIVEDFTTLHADYQAGHSEFTEARRFQALASVGHLATIYADHPDYDESWRP